MRKDKRNRIPGNEADQYLESIDTIGTCRPGDTRAISNRAYIYSIYVLTLVLYMRTHRLTHAQTYR